MDDEGVGTALELKHAQAAIHSAPQRVKLKVRVFFQCPVQDNKKEELEST